MWEQRRKWIWGNTGDGEIDRRTMGGFGIPHQDCNLYKEKAIFSHKRGNWQFVICGETRPKYEWAQIIGHVAATHGYKSMGKNEGWGIPEKEKYVE